MSSRRKSNKSSDSHEESSVSDPAALKLKKKPSTVHGVVELEEDPEVWQPYQLTWFRKVFRKDSVYFLLYFLFFAGYVLSSEPAWSDHEMEANENRDGRFLSQRTRLAVTTVFSAIANLTVWIDLYYATPPRVDDRKYKLCARGVGGHFSYLTVNIVAYNAYYWNLCLVGELLWIYHHRFEHFPVARAIRASYSMAVFSSTLGTILTLLFLKFNWYEPKWREDVLDVYIKRGNRSFVRKILFTHLNQLPIAFLDLVVVKQTHGVLNVFTPSLSSLFLCGVVYGAAYLVLVQMNWRMNGGVYPYPFLDKIMAAWPSLLSFYVVLTGFVLTVSFSYHFLAIEADYVERLVWGR